MYTIENTITSNHTLRLVLFSRRRICHVNESARMTEISIHGHSLPHSDKTRLTNKKYITSCQLFTKFLFSTTTIYYT